MGRAWVGSSSLNQLAIGLVARQAPRPVEHGQRPIRIGMHPHRDLHIMEPVRGLRNLQAQALIPVSFRIDVACASANKATVRPAH